MCAWCYVEFVPIFSLVTQLFQILNLWSCPSQFCINVLILKTGLLDLSGKTYATCQGAAIIMDTEKKKKKNIESDSSLMTFIASSSCALKLL